MRLLSLELEKYRNYNRFAISFEREDDISYIIGPNAQGKTNILEAIYLLALTKSFRTSKQSDLILWENEYCRVKGVFETKGEKLTLEAFYGKSPHPLRSFKKNDVKVGSVNFIGNCQIVFFHPEDLNMLYLGPDLRRRHLDILNVQINSRYYSALRAYKRVLEQRNSLLKRIKEGFAASDEINVWNEQLAEAGSIIISERAKTIEFLNKGINSKYIGISEKPEEISIEYKTIFENPDSCCGLPAGKSAGTENIKAEFVKLLEANLNSDLRREYTCVGPHRDDFIIKLRQKPLNEHASRGEYRSVLLSLKLLEMDFYEQSTGEKPILLLDDVFSELDPSRQDALLNSIKDCQTILTATHMDEYLNNRRHKGLNSSRERILCVNAN